VEREKERRKNMGERKKREESRKKRQQREDVIIVQQRTVIKRLIGSASSTHILQKLLDTLDSKRSYDKRIYAQGSTSNCSSSESESEPESEPASDYSDSEPELGLHNSINRPSSSKPLNGYKDLVLTGLSILWRLAGSEDNCTIIRNTKYLVSKIMAPVSYDLVHRTQHSTWSTSVVDASMRVMLRLMATTKDTKGDTGSDLHQQISSSEAITTMVKIVTCEECKGGGLQMTALQILMQLRKSSFTKMLVDFFIKGDHSDVSVRKTAGKELALLFLGSESVAALPSKEENEDFVGDLAAIVSQDGNDAECRKSAAEILEHMCIHYTKNSEYHRTLKNAMANAMPKVLREILLGRGLTGEEGKPGYLRLGTDIESQVNTDGRTNNKKNNNDTSSSPWQNQHHKLHVALLSLYVTACEKLHLDIDAISPGGDQGEGVAFRFAMRMVQSNKDHVTADSLTVIKLSTRMVIATMMKLREGGRDVIRAADLESLMESLTNFSETMLDLEGSMVFAAGTRTTVPATADTLDSLVKQARKLHGRIKNQY